MFSIYLIKPRPVTAQKGARTANGRHQHDLGQRAVTASARALASGVIAAQPNTSPRSAYMPEDEQGRQRVGFGVQAGIVHPLPGSDFTARSIIPEGRPKTRIEI